MKNPRLTVKERNLLKGAMRRVFSRSELRKKILDRVEIKHYDASRPRVTRWAYCETCGVVTPKYLMQVDHHNPIVPINIRFEDMTLDELVDNLWCLEDNLKAICKDCHKVKTKAEQKLRRLNKKGKSNE